jgi:DNA-binding MarR family transcriptional regulator
MPGRTNRTARISPGEQKFVAAMSEASRAPVTSARRKPASGIVPELNALITECFLLHGRLTTIFSTIKDWAQLSGMEALTLYTIVNSEKPVTVPQIGRSLGHARQVIQRAARALEARGLVETRDNPGHKRAALLVPTEAGCELKMAFDTAGMAITKTLSGGMDLATIRTTTAGLSKLRKNVEIRERELNRQPEAERK